MRSAIVMLAVLFLAGCLQPLSEVKKTPMTVSDGKFIVFVGISGSGKSTMAKELAAITNAELFLEPEEHEWPDVVTNSKDCGEFSAMMAFRNFRIKNLFQAKKLRDEGKVVVVDSYYDKITNYYLGKPGMEWLIAPKDPYYEAAKLVTILDNKQLPDADCLVLFDVDFETWQKFLKKRNRDRDQIPGFQNSYHQYRSYIEDAVVKLSTERKIKLIRFKQSFNDLKVQAKQLALLLRNEGIL